MYERNFPKSAEEALGILGINSRYVEKITCGEHKILRHDSENDRVETVKQVVYVCAEHRKPRKLMEFLKEILEQDRVEERRHRYQVLIFSRRMKQVKFVGKLLNENNIKCCYIHGKVFPSIREITLEEFRAGECRYC